MSLALIFSLLVLALLDSINPSALIVTLIILAKSRPDKRLANMLSYVLGIYVSYFIIGLLLVLGADAIFNASDITSSTTYNLLLGATGLSMLLYAICAPRYKPGVKKDRWSLLLSKALKPGYLFVFGIYVTTTEIITAWPYFAAIGLLAKAQTTILTNIAVLVAYCLIFILPPLVIALLYKKYRNWFDTKIANRTDEQRSKEREALLWIIGIIGFMLFINSLSELGVLS